MNIGTQMVATDGYGPLVPERIYYLLASQDRRVLLVWFVDALPAERRHGLVARPYMLALDRGEFEDGLILREIMPCSTQMAWPRWLADAQPIDSAALERAAAGPRSQAWLVEQRLRTIQPAVDDYREILNARDPVATLNQYARAARANAMRYRFHFLVYVLYGCQKWVLLPTYHRVGHWDRTAQGGRKSRLGRPSKRAAAPRASRLSAADRELILDTYRRYRGLGVHLSKIYVRALKTDWHCQAARRADGRFEIYHPDGQPFPTYRQYEYHLVKTFGRTQLQIDRRGREWVRNRQAISAGRFSEHVSNLLERVETDGYWSASHPVDAQGNPLPKLVTVTLADTLSATIFGVGFAFGSETAAAYHAACFSAAIGLERTLALFGLEAGQLDTPSAGLPPALITDRGPGSGAALAERLVFRELALSYSGQSKSTVESTHPRQDGNAEAPTFAISSLSAVGLARQELWRAVQQNHTSDASARLTPEMVAAHVPANPIGIWRYLEERGRTAGHTMRFEEAVRTFLQRVQFKITRDGLKFEEMSFAWPSEVAAERLAQYVAAGSVQGYCLEACVRHAWIEIDGAIYRVSARLPFEDDTGQTWISLTELTAHADRLRAGRLDQADNKCAAELYSSTTYTAQTDKSLDTDRKQRGRAKIRRGRPTGKRS
ncbi:hypothetical protein [Salinisphaera hydrothermalis]|uniref:hypothetical protein n=1 Tax=Salinisphaera hydrothermalis TaxID=563188 RepID=UPI003340118B